LLGRIVYTALTAPTQIKASSKKKEEIGGRQGQAFDLEGQAGDVDSLLHAVIDIDQSIVWESEMLQSDPALKGPAETPPGSPVDQGAKRIAAKALRSGELLHEARRQLKTPKRS
jgi:hypothetical protein